MNEQLPQHSTTNVCFQFYTKVDRVEVKEDYVIYDANSLIADVGGYLGLLLGYSALSIYQAVVQGFRVGADHFKGRN